MCDEDLGDCDLYAYRKLIIFIDGFRPGTCTFPNGDQLYDEDGHPLLAAQYINTKVVLECETKGEAMILLGKIYLTYFLFVCLFHVDAISAAHVECLICTMW